MESSERKLKSNNESQNLPSVSYLEELQTLAKKELNQTDFPNAEKIIREGLQKWPELIDKELGRFKSYVKTTI